MAPLLPLTAVHAFDQTLLEEALPLIAEATGVDFGGYRLPMVSRRLRTHMVALGVADRDEYLARLRASAALREAALERVTIKVSRFFRNPLAFDALAAQLETLCTSPSGARAWVAGCGTGEEVWTLAMLFARAGIEAEIVASDIDRRALATAERGVYGAGVLADVPTWCHPFLAIDTHGRVAVGEALRRRVQFVQHDLTIGSPPEGNVQLVSCRNVLIYFGGPYQHSAQATLLDALAPDGLLFLGEAEWLAMEHLSAVHVLHAQHRLFRRRRPIACP